MAVSWRWQHDVHEDDHSAQDVLALDGPRIVGRMFQINHGANAGRWFWIVMATGTGALIEPPTGVEERQTDAGAKLMTAYERLNRLPASASCLDSAAPKATNGPSVGQE